jgi:hypothetical protein
MTLLQQAVGKLNFLTQSKKVNASKAEIKTHFN